MEKAVAFIVRRIEMEEEEAVDKEKEQKVEECVAITVKETDHSSKKRRNLQDVRYIQKVCVFFPLWCKEYLRIIRFFVS